MNTRFASRWIDRIRTFLGGPVAWAAAHDRGLLERVPIGLYRTDPGGRIVYANGALAGMLGYADRESLLAVNAFDLFVDPDQRKAWQARIEREGVVRGFELVLRRRDGASIRVIDDARTIREARGGTAFYEGALRDVTERRRSEAHRRRLAEILEATPDFVGIATADGHPVYANPAGLRMLGATEDIDGGDLVVWDFHSAEWRERIRAEAIPAAVRDGSWSGETVFRSLDGRELPVSQVLIAHRDAAGQVAYFSTIARDISEKKALEQRIRHAQKMEAVGRLAGGIAHDFNNLLTAIIGHCELILREHARNEALVTDLEEIRRSARLGASLTRQLLTFSRSSGARHGPLDLNATVERVAGTLDGVLGAGVRLVMRLEANLPAVAADRSQIEHVLLNLALNARDAMQPDGGVLSMETARSGRSEIVLRVRDTGVGMDEETRRRAFEPFFTTKERGEDHGLGLGLATVYAIVQQSGGTVELESRPGGGTVVTIRLPCAAADPDAAADSTDGSAAATVPEPARPSAATEPARSPSTTEEARSPSTAEGIPSPSRTILVVEDEAAVRRVATRLLKQEGYRVLEAESGDQALRLLSDDPERLELLLTDVVMPGMRGTELAKRLRHASPALKVIFMSGYTEGEALGNAGRSDTRFLEKPFSPEDLLRMVRHVLA